MTHNLKKMSNFFIWPKEVYDFGWLPNIIPFWSND